jgi:hypothetical protein
MDKDLYIKGLKMQITGYELMLDACNDTVKDALNIRQTILNEIQRQWNEEPLLTKSQALDKIINILNNKPNK